MNEADLKRMDLAGLLLFERAGTLGGHLHQFPKSAALVMPVGMKEILERLATWLRLAIPRPEDPKSDPDQPFLTVGIGLPILASKNFMSSGHVFLFLRTPPFQQCGGMNVQSTGMLRYS